MKIKDIPFHQGVSALCQALTKNGVLLVVDKNPMTIGWATVGIIWSKAVITVLVRKSRYTYSLIEKSDSFAVCIPAPGTLEEELLICGSRSGKSTDKFKECNFKVVPGRLPGNNIITNCSLFYEAKIVHKNNVDPHTLKESILNQYYTLGNFKSVDSGDYHTIYFAEIKHTYQKESAQWRLVALKLIAVK